MRFLNAVIFSITLFANKANNGEIINEAIKEIEQMNKFSFK